jgi:hypothetical protein
VLSGIWRLNGGYFANRGYFKMAVKCSNPRYFKIEVKLRILSKVAKIDGPVLKMSVTPFEMAIK